MKTYDDALKYLDWLCTFGMKEGLERIKKLCVALNLMADNNCALRIPHCALLQADNNYALRIAHCALLHVAGTNGKGSVCALLAEMLKASGLKVGLFTSPHLESYCERIRINGVNISEADFAEMLFRVKECGIECTHFEALTAAAFLYFKEQAVDAAVIEVGLGGLYDSTNIIEPDLSIITNVALDHENILGDLNGIARNKAGIIKAGIPCVTGATGKPLEVIRATAKEKNAPLYEVTKPAEVEVNLRGEYQKINAAIAIKAAEVLGLSEAAIKRGLTDTQWAGRFEVVETACGAVVIDGAHNPDGAAALRRSLDVTFPSGRRVWLFGVLRDKDFATMIKILFRADDLVIVTEPRSERAASAESVCAALRARGIECLPLADNAAAVKRLMNSGGDVKIIAGSLYLIGAVRRKILPRT